MAVVQVTTTAPDETVASSIAGALLDQRLAACVQVIGPIRSRYRWEGRVEDATEWLCVAKTTDAVAAQVTAAIIAVHPYDVPEVLVSPVTGGHGAYLDWVATEVG